ncbi:hypothetical protein Tco_1212174 [Tanacetum coccineum]
MYENFNAPSIESLDSIFNRLRKIVSQLAILGENISQEDLNLKFLRILPSEWNTHVVVWRNKPDLDSMSFDDLYNNFKIVEQEIPHTLWYTYKVSIFVILDSSKVTNSLYHKESIKAWDQHGSTNTGGTVVPEMHGCSYKTFMSGKPHSFKGTEGVVRLKRWFEKIEQVFEIFKCAKDDKVKFAMCMFEGRALTWWNGNVQTLGLTNANQIPWSNVKAMMTTEYCPATEIQRMEQEL